MIVQILVHSHFDLVSSLLVLEATKLGPEPVTQTWTDKQSSHFSTVTQQTNFEMMLKSF